MKIIDLEEKDIQQNHGAESYTEGTEAIRFGELASFFTGLYGAGVPGLTPVENNLINSGIYILQNNKIKQALNSSDDPLEVSNESIKVVQKALDNRSNRKLFVKEFSELLEKDGNKSWKITNFFARLNSSAIKYAAKLIKNKQGNNLVIHTAIPVANIPKMINMWLDNQGLDYNNLPEPFNKYSGKAKNSTEVILAYLTDISNQAIAKVPEWANAPIPVFAAAISPLYIAIMTPKIKATSTNKAEGSESVSDLDLLESIFESEALESENTLEYLLNLHKDMGFEDVNDIAKMIKCEFNDTLLEKIYTAMESEYYSDILSEAAIESIENIIEMEGTEGLVKWIKDKANTIKKRRRLIDISEEEKNKFAESALEKFKPIVKSVAKEVDIELPEPKIEWKSNGNMLQLSLEGSNLANEKLETLQKIAKAIEDKTSQELPKLDPVDYWQFESDKSGCFLYYSGNFKRNK